MDIAAAVCLLLRHEQARSGKDAPGQATRSSSYGISLGIRPAGTALQGPRHVCVNSRIRPPVLPRQIALVVSPEYLRRATSWGCGPSTARTWPVWT
ncbi:uncharacterized protein UV8b_04765 [Ustilaginoidea virens]|uniref:Uncharacterized protein n=1 Tax=Ustilaginoidea virens TaxID=1159556 RepID=A0A8E5HRW9_USTVR|nr:uncharacterized protein UV8b_04765 [Ustilaginoidea virens]QUC20524.1 hypothetical protein UV8b_04765 [Ustilaginoidea virens]